MSATEDLVRAARGLPPAVRNPMEVALRSGWYAIRAGTWESDAGVCPVVAAGMIAGLWRDGHLADGGAEWGDEDEPSPAVFDFAVAFDLCAEERGLEAALAIVRDCLALGRHGRPAAAA